MKLFRHIILDRTFWTLAMIIFFIILLRCCVGLSHEEGLQEGYKKGQLDAMKGIQHYSLDTFYELNYDKK